MLADPALLERALANVIANAIRFSPAGRRRAVDAGVVDGRVDVRVVDRGPGVPAPSGSGCSSRSSGSATPAAARGSDSGSRSRKGFVEAMGGEIEVDDTPGGGLTVVIAPPRRRES